MTRMTRILAPALAALIATTVPAHGQAPPLRAEFAAPFDQAETVIIDGRMWSCGASACTSRSDDPRPAIACRKLARKVGAVARFVSSQGELDAAALQTCNQDGK